MTKEEFTAQIKSSLHEDIQEALYGTADEIIIILTKVYERGFWKGFEIGTHVEPRSEDSFEQKKWRTKQ